MANPTEQISSWCREGDQNVFRSFYRTHSPKLWKFLVARGCQPEAAYDLVAEAFTRFIQTVCRDPSAPVALLYRIAINLRTDAYRREKVAVTDGVDDIGALEIASPVEPEEHREVRELVKALPEREQNLLLLRYWIGLSHKEVAEALQMPEGTVRRQCAEVLDKLRDRWGGEDEKHAAR